MATEMQRSKVNEGDLDRANSNIVRMNHAHAERARVISRAQRQQQLKARNDIQFVASIEHANAVIDAYAAGCEHGHQGQHGGYTRGFYWGLCCGAVGGALATAAIMLARAWLALHAS